MASWLGLPVSSTHIAVGGVVGVGFFREWDAERRIRNARLNMPERVYYAPEERRRRKLVRRSHFMTIIAAWIITVPAAAILSAIIFILIRTAIG
jgi:PiT family inorganic phosphate transporter